MKLVEVCLGPGNFGILFYVSISTDHEDRGHIVLFERFFVFKLGKIRQGLFLVGWTEVDP